MRFKSPKRHLPYEIVYVDLLWLNTFLSESVDRKYHAVRLWIQTRSSEFRAKPGEQELLMVQRVNHGDVVILDQAPLAQPSIAVSATRLPSAPTRTQISAQAVMGCTHLGFQPTCARSPCKSH
jgi:hypothetical protein